MVYAAQCLTASSEPPLRCSPTGLGSVPGKEDYKIPVSRGDDCGYVSSKKDTTDSVELMLC
jgi:hypothetical protein